MCMIKTQKKIFFNNSQNFFMPAGLSAVPRGGLVQYTDSMVVEEQVEVSVVQYPYSCKPVYTFYRSACRHRAFSLWP